MASRIRRIDIARERTTETIRDIASELRNARVSAGRSQSVIAQAARISQSQLARIELGKTERVPLSTLISVATIDGLKLVVKLYPDGDVIRDAPQAGLLGRLKVRVGDGWKWRYEVLVAANDQRAWDASATHGETRATIVVETETRIRDVQALLRRITLKRDAAGGVRILLVVSDTHNNRAALAAARDLFAAEFPCSMRDALRAMANGQAPPSDAIIILAKERSTRTGDADRDADR